MLGTIITSFWFHLRASLVPVFSFGENDLYNQAENPVGSKLRKFQETFKKIAGFSPPIFYGRGVFNYTFGFLPHRRPINTVGKPLNKFKSEIILSIFSTSRHVSCFTFSKLIFSSYSIEVFAKTQQWQC